MNGLVALASTLAWVSGAGSADPSGERTGVTKDRAGLTGSWFVEVEWPQGMPRLCTATLSIAADGAAAAGSLDFHAYLYGHKLELLDALVRDRELSFRIADEDTEASFSGALDAAGELHGSCRWNMKGEGAWSAWVPPPLVAFDAPAAASDPFPRAAADEAGVDPAGLAVLVERARRVRSDALVVVKDGLLVCDLAFGRPRRPIEAMSATKSIVSLAIGLCLREGLLDSIDAPVYRYFPEWDDAAHRAITLRHLLTHTSGIAAERTTEKIYASDDFVEFALRSPCKDPPGRTFFYNNVAVNLLPGIVEKLSGERMDLYLEELLFEPLGITDTGWTLDAAGNPHGMSGLQIRAVDLARIGQLVLDGGRWKGEELLDPAWIELSTHPAVVEGNTPTMNHGLLWWLDTEVLGGVVDEALLDSWRAAGVDPKFLAGMEKLKGRKFGHDSASIRGEMFPAIIEAFTPPGEIPDLQRGEHPALVAYERQIASRFLNGVNLLTGPVRSFAARGYLGQTLVVVPESRIVAVRQRRYADDAVSLHPRNDYPEFEKLVQELVPRSP